MSRKLFTEEQQQLLRQNPYIYSVNILVTGNLDSGILETDIPEEGNSLIGLFTTYQVVRYCQAQSRFAVVSGR